MKKLLYTTMLMLVVASTISMKEIKTSSLRFNADGLFKIVQFTDIHFQYNSPQSDSALAMIKKAIDNEKPDLVVLTGDVVCSKNTKAAWLALTKPLIESNIPWAVTLGNHDIEYELNGNQIMETISGLPNNMTSNGPLDLSGNGNYILEINGSSSDNTTALLYFMDTHSGLKKENGMGSYDWIKFDQIEWFRNQSKKYTNKNNETPYPALAFFHIPLHEYKEIAEKAIGIRQEPECSPEINSGMYAALLESKDVMGVFTGHDHDNNYIGNLRGICLAYGQASGCQTYGKIGRGYRVIELLENQRKFNTWIKIIYNCDPENQTWDATNDSSKLFYVTYPDTFFNEQAPANPKM